MSEIQANSVNSDSIPIQLRAESPSDQTSIWRVNFEAFGQKDEADLVDALRDSGDLFASSVAQMNQRVVGHAALSIGWIERTQLLVLAPVAVLPSHQGRGIGEAVVRHLLAAAVDSPVTVLGDPDWYRRFEFEPADQFGVYPPFPAEQGALQLLRGEKVPRGVVTYAAPFLDM